MMIGTHSSSVLIGTLTLRIYIARNYLGLYSRKDYGSLNIRNDDWGSDIVLYIINIGFNLLYCTVGMMIGTPTLVLYCRMMTETKT